MSRDEDIKALRAEIEGAVSKEVSSSASGEFVDLFDIFGQALFHIVYFYERMLYISSLRGERLPGDVLGTWFRREFNLDDADDALDALRDLELVAIVKGGVRVDEFIDFDSMHLPSVQKADRRSINIDRVGDAIRFPIRSYVFDVVFPVSTTLHILWTYSDDHAFISVDVHAGSNLHDVLTDAWVIRLEGIAREGKSKGWWNVTASQQRPFDFPNGMAQNILDATRLDDGYEDDEYRKPDFLIVGGKALEPEDLGPMFASFSEQRTESESVSDDDYDVNE